MNSASLFPTSTRKHPVYFHYGWAEQDSITIELPTGFTLDNAEIPAPINAGVSTYSVKAGITRDGRTLTYERSFQFGNDNVLQFEVASYPQIKRYFDKVHESDKQTIALKQGAAVAAK